MLRLLKVEQPGLTVFRIVKDDRDEAVILDGLRSHYELHEPPRGLEKRRAATHMGLSVFDEAVRAEATARAFSKIGRFIAELRLLPNMGFDYTADTGAPGHMTMWGHPDQLRSVVAAIVTIEGL